MFPVSGFHCECTSGYQAITSLDRLYLLTCEEFRQQIRMTDEFTYELCVPICAEECYEHGCCDKGGVCNCDFGYVGGRL